MLKTSEGVARCWDLKDDNALPQSTKHLTKAELRLQADSSHVTCYRFITRSEYPKTQKLGKK